MPVNRKRIIVLSSVALVIILALVTWFFLRPDKGITTTPDPVSFPSGTSTVVVRPDQGSPTQPASSTSPTALDQCSGESSVIERNGCISDLAVESRDTTMCDAVIGALAKAACINSVVAKPVEIPKAGDSYQNFIETFVKNSEDTASDRTVSSAGVPSLPEATSTDPSFTLEGFVDRATTGGELKVFALSQYQAKPGETIYVYGSGFVYPSTVMAGSVTIQNLKSEDGFSLAFKAPSSAGEYEISVSNSKGYSGSPRPKLVVTNSPAPRPQITGATPAVADISGSVTLTGTGFKETNVVSTTIGYVENVSSNGSSLTFRIADLNMVSQLKDLPEVKGKKISVGVYVNNTNGFNKDLFYFDVQF